MTRNITSIFGVHISTAVCICICLCSREIKRETDRDKKRHENTVSVLNVYPFRTQTEWCLKVDFVYMCLCVASLAKVIHASLRHTQLLWI